MEFTQEELRNEIWKDVPSFEGFYQASTLGRIQSLERSIIKKDGKSNYIKETIRIVTFNKYGYLNVTLHKISYHKTYSVHRIVANTFIPNPDNKPQINHKDGIKTNNRACNLEWATPKENIHHAWENGLAESSRLNMSERAKKRIGGLNSKARIVVNRDNGVYYDTVTEAAFSIGMIRQRLNKMLSGTLKNTTNLVYAKK